VQTWYLIFIGYVWEYEICYAGWSRIWLQIMLEILFLIIKSAFYFYQSLNKAEFDWQILEKPLL
jgi:hypothetical protein